MLHHQPFRDVQNRLCKIDDSRRPFSLRLRVSQNESLQAIAIPLIRLGSPVLLNPFQIRIDDAGEHFRRNRLLPWSGHQLMVLPKRFLPVRTEIDLFAVDLDVPETTGRF